MENNIIIYNHPADDRGYIVQNYFSGIKHLSGVLESMIELSFSQKAVSQDALRREKINLD